MSYLHRGKVLANGIVEPGLVAADEPELSVRSGDDGLHIVDFNKGDFEWWYFDLMDQETGCFLKIVIHIGTDPMRRRIFPQLAISVNIPDMSDAITLPFALKELQADIHQCNLSLGNNIKIWTDPDNQSVYYIEIDVPRFRCNFRFTGSMEGWKPLGNEIVQQLGKKSSSFAWIIPMPRAIVEGDFNFEGKHHRIQNGVGYHDHNYIKVGKPFPLHMDELITRWYWGKCYAADYTVIFMDTHCRTNRLLSLMVADKSSIIYSANNLIECSVESSGFDPVLTAKYPESLLITSTDPDFHFQAELVYERILDRKDLLEKVHPLTRFLIRSLIAKPVYHGIQSSAILEVEHTSLQGYGNFESMVFRGK